MIEILMYKCDHCKKMLKSKGAIRNHEHKKCLCNPDELDQPGIAE
jgi:hypothetical protein